MKNQNEKTIKKEENRKKSDAAANKLYIMFFAALAAGFGVFRLGNSMAQLTFMEKIKPFCLIGTGVLLILAIIYKFICHRQGKDERFKTFGSSFLLLLAASLFAVVALFGEILWRDLLILIVIGTVLFFIYNIYEREFFWYSLYTALGYVIFDLKFGAAFSIPKVIVTVAAVLFALAVILATASARSRRGRLVLFGKTVGNVSEKGAYSFYATSALIIAGMILALFITGISPYSIAVLFISYMIFAVIYTLRMI